MDNLEEYIKSLLGSKISEKVGHADYHENFQNSGINKGREAVKVLEGKNVDLSKSVYFSIGGSTGGEIGYVLENSKIIHGVLLEFDPDAVNPINKLTKHLTDKGKNLIYIPGDAVQQAMFCRNVLKELRENEGIECVICSVQAVFHELPYRSPNFNFRSFLSIVLGGWNRCILLCREPCTPVDWPEKVELSIKDLPGEYLFAIAEDINKSLNFGETLCRVAEYVQMSASLAVETLFKIFYLEDYQYEIQEKLTGIDPKKLIIDIEAQLGSNSVTKIYTNSGSFEQYYRELEVNVRDLNNTPLPLPNVFLQIIADSDNAKKPPSLAIQRPKSPSKIKSTLEKKGFLKSDTIGGYRRFLRRRCRVIHQGSTGFKKIMYALLSRKFDPGENYDLYSDRIHELKLPHESMIARAVFMENIGAVSEMKNVINSMALRGTEESVRLLYKAIAHEKIEEVPQAIDCLYEILSREAAPHIIRAAQFNLNVCYEKKDMPEKVDFESFIADDNISFVDGERLSDKAVAMQLIHCIRTESVFDYKRKLEESLEYLFHNSGTGHIKTYLTSLQYDQQPLSAEIIKNFVQKTLVMDRNSQVAILTTLLRYTDPLESSELRNEIIEARNSAWSHKQSYKDPSILKWNDEDIIA